MSDLDRKRKEIIDLPPVTSNDISNACELVFPISINLTGIPLTRKISLQQICQACGNDGGGTTPPPSGSNIIYGDNRPPQIYLDSSQYIGYLYIQNFQTSGFFLNQSNNQASYSASFKTYWFSHSFPDSSGISSSWNPIGGTPITFTCNDQSFFNINVLSSFYDYSLPQYSGQLFIIVDLDSSGGFNQLTYSSFYSLNNNFDWALISFTGP